MGLKNIKTRFSTLPGVDHGSALNKNETPKPMEPIKQMSMPDIKPTIPKMGGPRRVDPKVNKLPEIKIQQPRTLPR